MKRLIVWFLFETVAGDRLLAAMEAHLGLAITPVETIDEAVRILVGA